MVLGCDDAHLLDEADAHRVYRTAAAGQLAVAATVRQDARHPVGVDRLWVEQLAERIEVAPFDRAATAAVLRERLGGRRDTGSLERLWSATRGNALVLRELVEHALDDGSLRRGREVWSWSGLAGDPPRRLADVLLLWLRDLSAQEEELVGMLAVAEPLEADAVARRGLASAAEALSRRGVVRVEQTGRRVRLRLALPLAGRTVVSRMPALTARRHGQSSWSSGFRSSIQVCRSRTRSRPARTATVTVAGSSATVRCAQSRSTRANTGASGSATSSFTCCWSCAA